MRLSVTTSICCLGAAIALCNCSNDSISDIIGNVEGKHCLLIDD